jgi:hypothetical protein
LYREELLVLKAFKVRERGNPFLEPSFEKKHENIDTVLRAEGVAAAPTQWVVALPVEGGDVSPFDRTKTAPRTRKMMRSLIAQVS